MLKNMDTKTDLNMLKGYVVATCKRKTTKERLKRARQNKFALGLEEQQ